MSHKEVNVSLTDSETGSVQIIDQVRVSVNTEVTSDSELNKGTDKENLDTTNSDNKDLLIDLSTDEGYQYSVDFDREKYLTAIREKNLLNTSIRPILVSETELRKIGTRTQKGIVHTQLEEVKRIRKTKMTSKIPLDKATLMIPTCTGERDVYQFIKACDLACSAVEKEDLPILTKYINTKLFDQALTACRYRDTSDWEGIKLILLDAFEPQQSTSSLQVALNSVRMRNNEDVGAYARRVEQLFYNLCIASTKNKSTEQATTIRDQLKEQTLVVFIKGLTPNLKNIVKPQKPPTLELAIQVAKDEEVELKSESEAYQYYRGDNPRRQANNTNHNNFNRQNNYFNNNNRNHNNNYNPSNNNNRPSTSTFNRPQYNQNPNYNRPQYNRNPNFNRPDINHGSRNNQYQPRNGNNGFNNNQGGNYRSNVIQCYQCGGNHIARNCNQNSRPSNNNFTRQPTNYNAPVNLMCTYCKIPGHDVTKCFRKQNNDRRNNNSGNLPRSDDRSGARPINLIATVEEGCQDDVYTSSQS
ncbi:putative uncharacterized protein DDB_G0286901 [Metopolophium dirhodum]|uniref:putative uncharacterized protein DDB_G0286901 n=1 Tax=Metopolophium dirhodum TaxID=44670 RepID=UPI00298FAB20|nr:putative uncharacterized protein DDB_G0286901 [Metopolophium dirhodum]XP_060860129.1 putative uncharacterized protein DDB_G0286901 [Metopolophium dirhodum]XP_060860130.1 putative uncharacterized protein DDB_G0286901 [Metopolophium dirhodum]